MTRKVKGSLRHLRRSVAPPYWPIKRKEYVWTVKPRPGPHSLVSSIPLGIILRDMLGYATTTREARRILAERKIAVDGRVVTDYKFPIGLMDVIHIIPEDKFYRVVPDPTAKLRLLEIPREESGYKLLRVIRKQTVKGGLIQLTLHDGRNILLGKAPETNTVALSIRTYDSVVITVPRQSLVQHLPLREGVLAAVTDGRNVGYIGRVESIQQVFRRRDALVTMRKGDQEVFRTILRYVMAIGVDKPSITLGVSTP